MGLPVAWLMLAGVILGVPLLLYFFFVRRYAHPTESTCCPTTSATLALSLALLTMAVVPIDIYTGTLRGLHGWLFKLDNGFGPVV